MSKEDQIIDVAATWKTLKTPNAEARQTQIYGRMEYVRQEVMKLDSHNQIEFFERIALIDSRIDKAVEAKEEEFSAAFEGDEGTLALVIEKYYKGLGYNTCIRPVTGFSHGESTFDLWISWELL